MEHMFVRKTVKITSIISPTLSQSFNALSGPLFPEDICVIFIVKKTSYFADMHSVSCSIMVPNICSWNSNMKKITI